MVIRDRKRKRLATRYDNMTSYPCPRDIFFFFFGNAYYIVVYRQHGQPPLRLENYRLIRSRANTIMLLY